jgi:Rieske Fe-S protein
MMKEQPDHHHTDESQPGGGPETRQPSSKRRSFLGALLGAGTVGVGALLSVPLAQLTLHPLFSKTTETEWSDLGDQDEFTEITAPVKRLISVEQRDGWRKIVSEKLVYITRSETGEIRALSPICPHLGCTISWNDSRGQFICPCHDAILASDGSRISGPPPRDMDELETRIEEGRLQVRYQYFRQLVPTKEVIA